MNTAEETKKEFIEQIFNKVCNVPSYSNLYLHTFYIIVGLGLHNKAKEERFFETEDCKNEGQREELILKEKDFLFKFSRYARIIKN